MSATTETEKETIGTVTTKEEKPTTTQIYEITASPSASYKTSSLNSYIEVGEPFPAEESKPIITPHPVTTSLKEMTTASKPVEIFDTTSEYVEQVMTSKLETAQMSTTTPILMSYPLVTSSPVVTSSNKAFSPHPVTTSLKELTTSSKPVEIFDTTSEYVEQVMTSKLETAQMSTTTPILMSYPLVTSSPVVTSAKPEVQMSVSLEEVIAPQVELTTSSSTRKPIVTYHAVAESSPVIEIMTSSKYMEQVMTPQIEIAPLSSTAKTIVTSHLDVKSSQVMDLMTSSKSIATSSKDEKEFLLSKTIEGSKSPCATKGMVYSLATNVDTAPEAVTSTNFQYSSQRMDMTSPLFTASMNSSHLEDVSTSFCVFKSTKAVDRLG